NVFFDALAYLPYDRNELHCTLFPKKKFVGVGYRNLNFFVLYANALRKRISESAWKYVKDNKEIRAGLLDHVFAKSSENLCGRLRTALKDHGVDKIGFGGFAAVKCGYEFVWYELGYTYFYAAHSSTGYKWQKKGRAYDSKAICGQIFFFP
ncbi:hypothetical protein AAVH_25509, partial [Aphelenchoides avenae]